MRRPEARAHPITTTAARRQNPRSRRRARQARLGLHARFGQGLRGDRGRTDWPQFTALAPVWALTSPRAILAADFDAGGDQDLLVGLTRFENDGSGTFTHDPAGVVVGPWGNPLALHAADVDADGDLDVFAGGCSHGPFPCLHLLLRNINGVLTDNAGALPLSVEAWGGSTLADVDHDGDVDAVVQWRNGISSHRRVAVWRNDGAGSFAHSEDLGIEFNNDNIHELIDMDGDGDADLLAGLWLRANRHWHLEAPFLAQAGTTYVLRCGGRALPNALALPWFGTRANIPLPPFGTLGLAPATALPMTPLFLSGELGEWSLPIPSNPTLLGSAFSVQTVLLLGGSVHLTPPKHEIVRS
jgi:hypothetical protein